MAAALGLAISVLLLRPGPAEAHAFLVRSSPQAGERLAASPASIRLQFSEPVAGGEQMRVKEAGGRALPLRSIERSQGGLVIQAPLPPLASGAYVVSWQALAQDGHLSLGEFAFGVGPGGERLLPSQPTLGIAWPQALVRWLFLVSLLLAAGGLASERFVWAPVAHRHGVAVPRLPIEKLLALALLGGILQAVLVLQQTVSGSVQPGGWIAALSTRSGLLAAFQVGLTAYALWLVPRRWGRAWALIPLTLGLAVAGVSGHSGSSPHWWAAPANVPHLIAVALWLGCLGHLGVVLWRLRGDGRGAVLAEGARRYAATAIGLVALTLATGLGVALTQFARLGDLLTTVYGRVLLIKSTLVLAAIGIALTARLRALGPNPPLQARPLWRYTRAEAALLVGTIATAAVLANVPPPEATGTARELLGPPPVTGPAVRQATLAGTLTVHTVASPDQLAVWALAPSGDLAPDAGIRIQGRAPDGTQFDVFPRPCGPGCVTSKFPWQSGITTLSVAATAKRWPGGTVEFSIRWPPQPEDPALLNRILESMRSQSHFSLAERVTSGPTSGWVEKRYELTGRQFIALELYAAGGATDVRPQAPLGEARTLSLYISGSSVWYLLEVDSQDRLQRETIVSPGHLIVRTFTYPTTPGS